MNVTFIYNNGYDYITIDGIECIDSTYVNMRFESYSTNITVQNCSTSGATAQILYPWGSGIYFGIDCTNVVIDHCASHPSSVTYAFEFVEIPLGKSV